ncbi:MAG: phosphate ABC transporter permease PstA [Alphaproteobacteria bacterium]
MTDFTAERPITRKPDFSDAHLRKRYRAEARFRLYGIAAIFAALAMLTILLGSIVSAGSSAFTQTEIALDVSLDPSLIDPDGTREPAALAKGNYRKIVRDAMRSQFPDVSGRRNLRALYKLVSTGSDFTLRKIVEADPTLIGTTQTIWFKSSADIDQLNKGSISRDVPEGDRRVNDAQIGWFDTLGEDNRTRRSFNTTFFTAGDSREPEQAGVWGAVVGTMLTLFVTLILSFPIGVMSAVYLEEFAPKNRWTDLIEVNINNLAAVPSIVFGLLGLAVFLNFFGLPRSAPLVGGLVLALMTLPTVIIAGRAALQSVPPSIREAALGVGASPLQTVSHHVLPLAMPGILTGTIIGMARALGETAPLLMIGMVAFIVDIPRGFTDAATVLPVQVFLWADAPERAFVERTSAAIMVLLAFLILMNLAAVLLRRKFERRW